MEKNVQQVWTEINAHYQEHSTQARFNTIKCSMYAPNEKGFPSLKGKAGEIRHLAPALLACFQKHMNIEDEQHQSVELMLELAIKIEATLDEYADHFVFPKDVIREFQKSCFAFVALNSALGDHYHNTCKLYFHHTVKFHYILHIAQVAAYINPRLGWCYSGEDLMSKVKVLIQGSNKGTKPSLVTAKAMKKYIFALSLSMSSYVVPRR